MPRIVHFAVVMVFLAGGCSGGGGGVGGGAGNGAPEPAPGAVASPSGSAAPTTSSDAAQIDDPPGLITCREVAAALRDATLLDDGVVDRIRDTSATADAPVTDAATALAEAYTKAVAARGSADEPDAVAAVSAAAVEMSEVCGDSGLESIR
ncbi:hypothetical protein [Actinoplanes sp. GCM10030250]|uniref:hypothetical protein n=1 Tax=Actinoplanes sp. GCM10030250 TaxID=3273376 RepID=UPI00360EAC52